MGSWGADDVKDSQGGIQSQKFNANFIKTSFGEEHPTSELEPFGLMIATQKPTDEQRNQFDFWSMIVDNDVAKVINLTEFDKKTEDELSKSFYFPTEKDPKRVLKVGESEIIIELSPDKSQLGDYIDRRTFNITFSHSSSANDPDSPKVTKYHSIEHVHYT